MVGKVLFPRHNGFDGCYVPNRFEEFRRDVRVVSVVVLFEFFGLGGVFVSFRNNTLNDTQQMEDVDDGNGHREGSNR